MSIGIRSIGSYIPECRVVNIGKEFNGEHVDSSFILNKVGIKQVSRKSSEESVVSLCMNAFNNLLHKDNLKVENIDCICLVTQNGDYQIPHTSAILHGKLGLSKKCAVFDISLGCSGYVYALNIMQSLMNANGYKNGLLFTCDPYSKIVSSTDKNTDLLFGDAATVTLLSNECVYDILQPLYYTDGSMYEALIKKDNSPLFMDGRLIFNFVMAHLPIHFDDILSFYNIAKDEIDLYIFHQASKYIIDNIIKRLRLEKNKVVYNIENYGNTVSSSIPLVLENYLDKKENGSILLSGFGVGLSIGSVVLKRC